MKPLGPPELTATTQEILATVEMKGIVGAL